MLISAIANKRFDYVISFGQRSNMKDKVHIETTAKEDGLHINTNFDCIGLKQLFEKNITDFANFREQILESVKIFKE